MALSDGRGRVRKLWGGYSPKIFDGHFIEERRKWFEKHLAGAEVIADQHFRWGQKHLKKVTFHIAKPEPKKEGGRKNREDNVNDLTAKEKKVNIAIKESRARVEIPFGVIAKKFAALSRPWAEEDQQLDYLVTFAIGVANCERMEEV
jgi:hypothetical protein